MIIEFNTDHNIIGKKQVVEPLTALITDQLNRFSDRISRIVVHLTDEDGKKKGQDDKRCVLEARVEGLQPIAVTNHGNTRDQAVQGAIIKLKTSLNTKLGRLNEH